MLSPVADHALFTASPFLYTRVVAASHAHAVVPFYAPTSALMPHARCTTHLCDTDPPVAMTSDTSHCDRPASVIQQTRSIVPIASSLLVLALQSRRQLLLR
ncbi:hypothetical protein DFP72DRAFT_1069097 [Ephemerocybe angulata]|uniref:Uncharacterized protein n=1 Tax=Ephemerocybe angulata TaxID=980116 RepID=A0A8H6HVY0_9AGAR|nr:hypothetical protein DFP72DRAFT_1069097 [Tulosesus angulatus]